MAKRYEENLYVFAVAMRLQKTTARFTVSGLPEGWPIDVLGKHRKIISDAEAFSDPFAPYAVHRYRILGYFATH